MNRGEKVLANYALTEHDGVLIVVTLPRHVCHEEVASECKLTATGSVTLSEDVALLHTLTLVADRTKVDGHILVGAAELRNLVFLHCRHEAYEFLFLCAVVEDADGGGINILNDTLALCYNHGA